MTKAISRGLVVVFGLLAAQGTADSDSHVPDAATVTDPRLLRIKEYFLERDCPAHVYAEDFVTAADQNDLDWRLLPSLSMVESTGGKASRNNNMFGWDNGDTGFRTSREGIYRVASRLNRSRLYRNKNLDGLLKTYNPRPEYRVAVKSVMAQLGPLELVPGGAF